ncbi:MAG: hypothetical protein MJY44_05430 [Bacteroidales bacterium]|nr:hypothetical protein [Bacteroidales bacterium]
MDSLVAACVFGSDSLSYHLDSLRIRGNGSGRLRLGLRSRAEWFPESGGEFEGPLDVDALVKLEFRPSKVGFDLRSMRVEAAGIPIDVTGVGFYEADSLYLEGSLGIDSCRLGDVMERYGAGFLAAATDISSDAVLDLRCGFKGAFGNGRLPAVSLSAVIPRSNFLYKPLNLAGKLGLDASATLSPEGRVDASLGALEAETDGMSLALRGNCADLLADDAFVKMTSSVAADLEKLLRFLPDSLGVEADGRISVDLDAGVALDELDDYKFRRSKIRGKVVSERVNAAVQGLGFALSGMNMGLGCGERGLVVLAGFDTLRAGDGADLRLSINNMRNSASVSKVKIGDSVVPRIAASTSGSRIFMRKGMQRVALGDLSVRTSATRRVMDRERKPRRGPERMRARPEDDDFKDRDIEVKLDDRVSELLGKWNPKLSLHIGRGFAAHPSFPLRTRLDGVSAKLDANSLMIDSIGVRAARSDLRIKGEVRGIRAALFRRGVLGMDLDVDASRINVNEIVAAFRYGDAFKDTTAVDSEVDEGAVLDTIGEASEVRASDLLFVVPSNVAANIEIQADTVDYSSLHIEPFTTQLTMRNRTLRMQNTLVASNMGDMTLEAYYSTKSKSDIKAGFDLDMNSISAEGIIELVPMVDSILPLLKSFKGSLGCRIAAVTDLDTNMNVMLPSLKGVAHISGENLYVEDAGDLKRITRMLMFKNKDIGDIRNLSVDAVVGDGRIDVYPFILGVDRYVLALSGVQGMDRKFDYHVSLIKTPLLIPFGINIYGGFDKWKFKLVRPLYVNENIPAHSVEINELHYNIAEGIRDIYKRGVDEVMAHVRLGERMRKPAEESSRENDGEAAAIDEALLDFRAEEEMADVIADAESVIEDTAKSIEEMQRESIEALKQRAAARRGRL